jgi:hypothetical protein
MSASAEAVSARPAERPPAWENLLYELKAGHAGGLRPPSAGYTVRCLNARGIYTRQRLTKVIEKPTSPSTPQHDPPCCETTSKLAF